MTDQTAAAPVSPSARNDSPSWRRRSRRRSAASSSASTSSSRQTLICLLAGGHALLEGVPGLGKTMLVRTLAEALEPRLLAHPVHARPHARRHHRHQRHRRGRQAAQALRVPAGPDLRATSSSPTRSTAPRPRRRARCSRRCRSTASPSPSSTYTLDEPFFVLATQNPLEMEGTYPLPEAQLDRFFFKLARAVPDREELHAILDRTTGASRSPAAARSLDGDRRSSRCSSWCGDVPIARTCRTTRCACSLARTRQPSTRPTS